MVSSITAGITSGSHSGRISKGAMTKRIHSNPPKTRLRDAAGGGGEADGAEDAPERFIGISRSEPNGRRPYRYSNRAPLHYRGIRPFETDGGKKTRRCSPPLCGLRRVVERRSPLQTDSQREQISRRSWRDIE